MGAKASAGRCGTRRGGACAGVHAAAAPASAGNENGNVFQEL